MKVDVIEMDDDDDDVQEIPITVAVSPDAPWHPPTQLVMSLAEAKAMSNMPGGISFGNWLRIRGLSGEPTKES